MHAMPRNSGARTAPEVGSKREDRRRGGPGKPVWRPPTPGISAVAGQRNSRGLPLWGCFGQQSNPRPFHNQYLSPDRKSR